MYHLIYFAFRYIEEKEYRAQISKENHKIAKREWIRNKRQNDYNKQLDEYVKMQHNQSSIVQAMAGVLAYNLAENDEKVTFDYKNSSSYQNSHSMEEGLEM